MKRGVGIVVASCLAFAACGGSGDDADSSTTTASTATTTTTAATTTTEAPVEPTEAPSTTLDTEAQLAAAEQAYLDAFAAYIAAARDPSNPDLRAEIERLYTGPNLEFTVSQLDAFVENNWIATPGEEPSRTIILLSPQTIPDRDELVELVACDIDGEVFIEPGGAPDGSDALVNDAIVVTRGLVRMELVDGQWKARSGETLAELSSPADCEP